MTEHQPPARSQPRGPRTWTEARAEAHRHREKKTHKLQHDERMDRLRTLAARRTLVVVGYLLAATAAGLAWWDPPGLAELAVYLTFLVGVGLWLLLQRVVRGVVDAPDEALDERLVAVRDAAYRTAHTAVFGATGVAIFALMFAAGDGWFVSGFDVEQRHLEALFFAFALGAGMSTSAVLAWKEREV
jgi:uncharacterized membrane protein